MKLGFIGAGNMAQAIIGGIIGSGTLAASDIIASAATQATLDKVEKEFGINVTLDNKEIAANVDCLVLAVKPMYYPAVIEEVKDVVKDDVVIITIAPGFTLEKLGNMFGRDIKIVRTMPNTPAMVKEGMTAACKNEFVTEEDMAFVTSLLDGFGKSEIIDEHMMEAVISVSGSSPAYVYMFIEALADGAVALGMPRAKAYKFAAQAVYGSAKMVLETGMHPGALKDMVCSPGGTTIEAVRTLEGKGFRSSVLEAMMDCAEKARNM